MFRKITKKNKKKMGINIKRKERRLMRSLIRFCNSEKREGKGGVKKENREKKRKKKKRSRQREKEKGTKRREEK